MSSIFGVGPGAAQTVASALAPRSATSQAAAKPKDSTGTTDNSSGTSDSNSATITANDFLTLLVSELKNQDPTQPTDPTEYITQMVGVNSLQQLIDINQGLASVEGTSTTSASS
jgi:flagellar basal-body rod modification protein FlgD